MSPESRFLILPAVCAKRSQMDSPLPSSFQAPSIWYEAMAVPQKNPLGKAMSAEGASADGPKWWIAELAEAGGLAFEDRLQLESSAGRPAAAPALSIDWINLRRVRGNWRWN